MAEWTVIVKRPDGGIEFDVVEDAEYLDIEPDLYKGGDPTTRYYVLKDQFGDEIARFNEKDIVGIRKGRRLEISVSVVDNREGS